MLVDHLRFACRLLIKQPAFSITAILTLALAIGANTAVFSLVNAVLVQPPPYPQPDRLALLARTVRAEGRVSGGQTGHTGGVWDAVREHATTVDRAVFTADGPQANLVVGDRPLAVTHQRVGAGFFAVLGVGPILGREFVPDEDRVGGPAALILSDRLWRSAFQADPDVIGRVVTLRGEPHTVVGVMPRDFRGLVDVDAWTALQASATGQGGGMNYQVLLRVRPEATWPAAGAEMAAIADPVLNQRASESGVFVTHSAMPLQQASTQVVERPLLLLWGAVIVVLLVACVNLAGLFVARAARRTREIATRLALGGARRTVLAQLLTESLLLAAIGGVLGLGVGAIGLELLKRLTAGIFIEFQDVPMDATVIGATMVMTAITALVFGLVPAIHASRLDVHAALIEGGTRSIAGGVAGWPRRLLLVAEVACGVVLLVGGGLLTRTFVHLNSQPPGFDLSNLVAAAASLEDARYRTPESVERLFANTLAQIEALPGVESAAASLGLPYERILNIGFRAEGSGDERGAITNATYVAGDYFRTLRIPVRLGRAFAASDTRSAAPVAVVNESFVRMYMRNREPIGSAIAIANGKRTVIGVVGDVQQQSGFGDFGPVDRTPIVYLSLTQVPEDFLGLVHTWFTPKWIVRARADPQALVPSLRQAIAAVDPLLPLASVREIGVVRSASLARQRLLMALVGALAVAAALLAALGIYGLIASLVSERLRELGIRLALGASIEQAMRTVMMPGVVLTMAGLAIGSALALGASGVVRRLLWGVSPTDPLTFGLVALTLLVVAVIASLIPALRVRRVDPASLLRD